MVVPNATNLGECVTHHAIVDAAEQGGSSHVSDPADLTTSEQMFFFGAPLAHVQRYEQELRAERARRAAFRFRAHRHYAPIAQATH